MANKHHLEQIRKTDATVKMLGEIENLSNSELYNAWRSHTNTGSNPNEYWDDQKLISMEEWVNALYSELCHRGLAGH